MVDLLLWLTGDRVLEVTATVHKPRAADSMGLDDVAVAVSVGP